jgi:repressor LexA
MRPRTTREKVYAFIHKKILEGLPPSVREIQEEFGFKSVGTAREHIDRLVEDGRIERLPETSRGLRLPVDKEKYKPEVMVRVMGTVQAGVPQLAFEEPCQYIPFRTSHKESDLFALKVRGESMTGAGILPGDYVIVLKQEDANIGQIVVAMLGEEEATVKILKVRNGQRELHPANKDYPILAPTPKRKLTILGVVLEVRRRVLEEQ